MSSLCLGCSSTIPDNVKVAAVYVHGCCGRKVCAACLDRNARLATFCPMCEDAHAAFRKGPRSDVTRAGQVVFDAESALAQQDDDVAPPPYTESGRQDPPASAFVLEDGEDSLQKIASSSESASASEKRKATPALLRQASKASAEAEIDTAPQRATSRDDASADVRTDSLVAHRRKVDPHEASPSEPTSSRRGDGETRQYWLRNIDTLAAIAIRFGVSTHELCLLNALPRAVLSTSPHLLHTRTFILIPAHAVDQQLAANPELAASLQGPPLRSAREKTAAARRNAQAKFRAALARNAASSSKTTDDAPPDDRAARAYVALAEDEFRLLDFGEGTDADGLALPYDSDEAEDAMLDAARARRFDAVLTHALARWHMDSVWERQQRANGLDPSSVRAPAPAPTPPTDPAEKDAASTSAVGRWFARALNADASDAQRGEHKSRSPRHVVALSSSVKLPTHLTQTAALTTQEDGVIAGDEQGSLLGWDMVSSERVPIGPKHAAAHAKPILWLEANPDTTLTSTEIVTASADGTVKIKLGIRAKPYVPSTCQASVSWCDTSQGAKGSPRRSLHSHLSSHAEVQLNFVGSTPRFCADGLPKLACTLSEAVPTPGKLNPRKPRVCAPLWCGAPR
ncbi:hypothetical protein L1887_59640 [Cichorium endivia]|nr:hypothetical protein L1887_59640 [Cichorium endivia]